jgi:hypothetical protein
MKSDERGPFSRIRWFCKDGSVLPPDAGCAEHGGGWQHGEWSERTQALRAGGYKIANILAGIDADRYVSEPDFPDTLAQLLVERFLVAADDGWIFRRALFYRGAVQEEDEREAARQLLIAMAARPAWILERYPALRTGARLLPHGEETASLQKVRQGATALSERDFGFARLRAKIHAHLEASDAEQVRGYGRASSDETVKAKAEALAGEIERLFQPPPLADALEAHARFFSAGPWLQELLRQARSDYLQGPDAPNRYRVTARLLADLRENLPRVKSPSARIRVIDLSLAVEADHFLAAAALRATSEPRPRVAEIALLRAAADAAYGAGMIDGRQLHALRRSFSTLETDQLPLEAYRRELRYLSLVPGWAAQGLRFHFGEAMETLGRIEPLAGLFVQDQLRAGPLTAYAGWLDRLLRDGQRLAGVRHRVFGQEVGLGLEALNPGLARGVLQAAPDMREVAGFRPDGIYVLPETVADLPPVRGILTLGAGNPLSHVQLLARNLGIPNIAVAESLLELLRANDGRRVVLAVSPSGLVEIDGDGERWEAVFGASPRAGDEAVIEPDLAKLDLSETGFVSLDRLSASDSGRIVGPKAAKLGELRRHFPEAVVPGVAIPFGLFKRTVLDRTYRDTGQSVFEWMTGRFRRLEALPADSADRQQFADAFRAELYDIVRTSEPGPEFRRALHAAMAETFGAGFSGGVFVRSDTNVEDLPGFTGAGLNLTRPNVTGFDNVLTAITEVWASPFSARAFAWRQNHMRGPEHVYPSVLLMQTVPAEKSGVLVTQDLASGDRQILSVAANEGVGGAVDGQAAESLRIDTRDGAVRLLASATAARRLVPRPEGGMARLPASGADTVLAPEEIETLIEFARELPGRFPAIVDSDGRPAAADVEFAFVGGRLFLLQIRPFNESRSARSSAYLAQMDAALENLPLRVVNLQEVPR